MEKMNTATISQYLYSGISDGIDTFMKHIDWSVKYKGKEDMTSLVSTTEKLDKELAHIEAACATYDEHFVLSGFYLRQKLDTAKAHYAANKELI